MKSPCLIISKGTNVNPCLTGVFLTQKPDESTSGLIKYSPDQFLFYFEKGFSGFFRFKEDGYSSDFGSFNIQDSSGAELVLRGTGLEFCLSFYQDSPSYLDILLDQSPPSHSEGNLPLDIPNSFSF